MDFGMPTLISLNGAEENAALCHKLGLQFVELNMNLPEYQPDKLNATELNRLKAKYGIYFTIHLDENLNVWDFNSYVAKAYMQTVSDAFAAAEKIGAHVLNMHMAKGVYFTLPDSKPFLFAKYGEHYKAHTAAFIEMCDALYSRTGVKVSVENTNGFEPFQIAAIDEMLCSDAFMLTYDVGHDCTAGGKDLPFILERQDRLKHMHLHDSTAKSCHLPFGSGTLDLHEKLALAKKCGCRVVIEVKTPDSLQRSVALLPKYL